MSYYSISTHGGNKSYDTYEDAKVAFDSLPDCISRSLMVATQTSYGCEMELLETCARFTSEDYNLKMVNGKRVYTFPQRLEA